MVDDTRARIATLLDEIADEPIFDKSKYGQLTQLAAQGNADSVIGEACNEVVELYVTWEHAGKSLARNPKVNEKMTEQARDNLRLFARAIRAGVTDFKSVAHLKQTLEKS